MIERLKIEAVLSLTPHIRINDRPVLFFSKSLLTFESTAALAVNQDEEISQKSSCDVCVWVLSPGYR